MKPFRTFVRITADQLHSAGSPAKEQREAKNHANETPASES